MKLFSHVASSANIRPLGGGPDVAAPRLLHQSDCMNVFKLVLEWFKIRLYLLSQHIKNIVPQELLDIIWGLTPVSSHASPIPA